MSVAPPYQPVGQMIRVGTDQPTPCGLRYVDEVLVDSTGAYVGDMTGPSSATVKSGFTSGQAFGHGDPDTCCGGVNWYQSPFWEPPSYIPGCGVENYVPLSAAWHGVLDPQLVPAGDSDAFHFIGTGLLDGGVAFERPGVGFDYWEPDPGSWWVSEGWVRCDSRHGDVAGTNLAVGYAALNGGAFTGYTGGISTTWSFFRRVFQINGVVYTDRPKIPVWVFSGPKMANPETQVKPWPTEPGSCAPNIHTQPVDLTKARRKGGFYLKCLHVYPYTGGETINRRFGRE